MLNLCSKKSIFEFVYTSIVQIDENLKDKKILEKIVLVDVQKDIYENIEKTLINLLHNSGYPAIKIEKKIDKIVLDEIGMAISLGFIEENDLIFMINNRPSSTDIILTGPSIPPKIIEMADQITELRCN